MANIKNFVFFENGPVIGVTVPAFVFNQNAPLENPVAALEGNKLTIMDGERSRAYILMHESRWVEKLNRLLQDKNEPTIIVALLSAEGVFDSSWEMDLVSHG